ncbi:alpha-mannosidase [Archaeoglobus veneficus]|uniref:Glycoside hydrolase family 38 n=1 Tax=Archaeoglobus veneficus (strain DSM 11195 / SNP6) TaxID=693661 RepID=F2KSV9_ARCVS|nr:glycoside hydrolase family 38 C-terminal domain-containing protein [Archaeoglobus veneficus]AEA47004.1 glycoside hydrolase family 38 [Archaeoglobus veneficus SNP6]
MANEKADVIYLVPHTHYDAIWVFTKEDYFYINIDLILKKVIEMLENTKEYKFLIEQVYLLEEVERRYPEIFRKIREFVRKGRIEIADGEYLMADTMLPQEETLIREILVGKRFVREKFGVDVNVMWQADSFGLNAQLPQIYRKCGYKYVAFRRGCPENKPSEFIWEGLDGTKIIAHFMPLGYRAGLDLRKLEDSYRKLKRLAATNHILMPSGSGVTMPQEETVEVVENWNKKHRSVMKIATPSEFFKAIEKHANKLPIRRGEMYSGKYSEIFPDVASSRIWLKKNLRKYENWLMSFERFATIYSLMDSYTPEELEDCWKKILFLAFHDVVPGTGMDTGYAEVRQHIGFLDTQLTYLMPRILKSIAEMDAEAEDYGDVIVFNPLSWDVSNWVEVDLNFEEGQVSRIEGLKCGEEEIDVEVIRFTRYEDESLRYARIGFVANVPALGYKVYKIMERKPKRRGDGFIRVIGNTIENRFFKVRFSPENGLIEVFKDEESLKKEVCTGNELVIEEEIGDLYYHKETMGTPLKTESGEGVKYGSFRVKNFWIDKSPLRRVINIETDYFSLRWPYRLTDKLKPMIWRHKFISFKKKVIIYRDIPRIDFVTIVDNGHPRIRLRVKFSTCIKCPEYVCETQFGAVMRKTNQYYFKPRDWKEQPSGVYPTLRWIDYSDGEKGLTVINKGNPENEVRDEDIYITLLRSVDMLSSDGKAGPVIPVPDARELKKYVFRYSIYPHEGNWVEAKSYKQGYEFNYDLIALQLSRSNKYRLKRSFLKIEPDNVILTALKRAEDGNGVILRFYEASGTETEATITLFREPKEVEVVNMIEEKDEEFDKDVKVEGNKIFLELNPFEVVTLRLKL